MDHWIAVTIHLLCATVFIGVVFFEVLLLEGIRSHVGAELMDRVEIGLVRRARWIMPWVVGGLFLSGLYMGIPYFANADWSWGNAFIVLLSIKVVLAVSVLAHFVTAMVAAHRGRMTEQRFRLTHISVGVHMVLIVVLAKAMFYASW